MKTEYFLFNSIIFLCPFIVTYLKNEKGYLPKIKPYLFVLLFVSIPFIVWDHYVSGYFWSFNPAYITGVKIGNLPVEEILFFLSVPYACLFIWVIIDKKIKEKRPVHAMFPFLFMALFPLGIWYVTNGLFYTGIVYMLFGAIVVADMILGTSLFRKKKFYQFLLITLGLTLVWNGYLTARPVVTYNQEVKTHIQVFTIPLEDFMYALCLLGLCVVVYEKSQHNKIFTHRLSRQT